jgi:ribose/xylose/arabinose/galactoside ABC-type transport system permease subunit
MVATLILFTAGRGIAQLITAGQITYVVCGLLADIAGIVSSSRIYSADQLPVYKAVAVVIIVVFQSPVFRKKISGISLRKAVAENAR